MTDKPDTRPAWAIKAEEIKRAKASKSEGPARNGFWILLVGAAVSAAGAVFVVLKEDSFYESGEFGGWMYLILLISFILSAFYLILAYRVTPVGQRLLDMTPLRPQSQMMDHVGFGFDTPSASSEKRAASARIQARQARRAARRQAQTDQDA